MNILPKKRWHVRTKENIARVRRDEAEAAEKKRQEELRVENADREARLNVLKLKSKQKLQYAGITKIATPNKNPDKHINLFEDLEHAVKTTNIEHDQEVKEKKEEYEKKIGYLTYLGQDTNEALGKKNWYEVAPGSSKFSSNGVKDTYEKLVLKDADGKPKEKELDIKDGEIEWKSKQRLDPIHMIKKHSSEGKVTSKQSKESNLNCSSSTNTRNIVHNHKKHKEDKKEKLLKLREARLKRERNEKHRAQQFLMRLNGETGPPPENSTNDQSKSQVKPKYNSQFNPELARQNYR